MVLLPAVERDSVVGVIRSLVIGRIDAPKVLITMAVVIMLGLPFVALSLVLRDLIHFYFHSNHLRTASADVFAPRFTLTGLRLPSDDLGEHAAAALTAARSDRVAIELLVPANDRSRAAIDRRITAYGGLGVRSASIDDQDRANALLLLAASRSRDLISEVAKVEHGMARHVLRTQTIVLRYAKALLVLLATAMATFAAAAVVEGREALGPGAVLTLAVILLAWAPIVIVAVTAPVRWLDRLLRSEGAIHTAVADDRELTKVEMLSIRLAACCFGLAFMALVIEVTSDEITVATQRFGLIAGVVLLVATVVVLATCAGRRVLRRA